MNADSVIHPLGAWDYLIIAFYMAVVLFAGFIFRRQGKNASEYFRGGGNMLWWMAGMSAMTAGLTTWTFTGGAAKCYEDGFLLPCVYLVGIVPALIGGLYAAPLMRRLRVITAMEAVFRRYGFGAEQLYTWITLPLGLFLGGVGLNTLGVFLCSFFGTNLATTIVVSGLVMTVLSTVGGQWGVAASSFVQGLIMHLIVFVVIYFSIYLPQIGGPTHLLAALPARHLHFDIGSRGALVAVWIGWSLFGSLTGQFDLRSAGGGCARVKDERQARNMVLLMTVPGLLLLMPILIQLPAMCAAVVFPNLHQQFPQLSHPEEAAWVAMAFKTLPHGLLGVMVCGIFATGIPHTDAALNQNAGFFVRNIYIRYIRRAALDHEQVVAGKIATVTCGLLMVLAGLAVNAFRTNNLFDFFQLFNAIVFPPMAIPMIGGFFIKRTPRWSGWSTVVVGLFLSLLATHFYSPELIGRILHDHRPLNARETTDSQAVFVASITFFGSLAWFAATIPFYRYSPEEHLERVESFFADMSRPIDRVAEGNEDEDLMQYKTIGGLCLLLGAFMLACVAIPNPMSGRLAFVFIGGVVAGLGAALYRAYQRKYAALTKRRPVDTSSEKGAILELAQMD